MNMTGVNFPVLAGKTLPPDNTNWSGNFRGISPNPAFQSVFLNLLQGEFPVWSEPIHLDIGALLDQVEQLLQSLGFALADLAEESPDDVFPVLTRDAEGDGGFAELDAQILAFLGLTGNGNPVLPFPGRSGQPSTEAAVPLLESIRLILLSAQKGELRLDQAALRKISVLVEQIAGMGEAHQALHASREPALSREGGKVLIASGNALGPVPFHPGSIGREVSSASQLPGGTMTSGQAEEAQPHLKKIGFHQFQGIRPLLSDVTVSDGAPPARAEETYVREGQFHRRIQDLLVRQIQMTRFPNGVSEARIKLVPEHLGAIDIRISVQQGVVTAQFAAETQLGKELLESHLQALRTHLVQQGFHVEKLEIAGPNPQGNQAQSHFFAGDDRQQRGREPVFQQNGQDGEEPEQQFAELMQTFDQQI